MRASWSSIDTSWSPLRLTPVRIFVSPFTTRWHVCAEHLHRATRAVWPTSEYAGTGRRTASGPRPPQSTQPRSRRRTLRTPSARGAFGSASTLSRGPIAPQRDCWARRADTPGGGHAAPRTRGRKGSANTGRYRRRLLAGDGPCLVGIGELERGELFAGVGPVLELDDTHLLEAMAQPLVVAIE